MGSGCGSQMPHHITPDTANPLGVLFAPTKMVINDGILIAQSLQTNRPQKLQAAWASLISGLS